MRSLTYKRIGRQITIILGFYLSFIISMIFRDPDYDFWWYLSSAILFCLVAIALIILSLKTEKKDKIATLLVILAFACIPTLAFLPIINALKITTNIIAFVLALTASIIDTDLVNPKKTNPYLLEIVVLTPVWLFLVWAIIGGIIANDQGLIVVVFLIIPIFIILNCWLLYIITQMIIEYRENKKFS